MGIQSKILFSNEPDRSGDLNKLIADRTNRTNIAKIIKISEVPADMACFEMARELEVFNTDNEYCTINAHWVYKVNCPGWLYVAYKDENFASKGNVSILLAKSRANLVNESNRLLYLQGSSSTSSNANTMVPIYPGTSTFMCIHVNDASKSVVFVPAAMSVSLNIYQPSYVDKVGTITLTDYTTGSISKDDISGIFESDWRNNFKSVAGVWVSDESKFGLDDDDKFLINFKKERQDWLTNLGLNPNNWGYGEEYNPDDDKYN